MAKNIFVSYNGSQVGFTVRDAALNQLSYSNNNIDASGISAGTNDDIYLTSANHIYHCQSDGALIKDMVFPEDSIKYTGVVVQKNHVYACYTGSQKGVTVRDLTLNQVSSFDTGINANGIAVSSDNDIYIAAGNHICHYTTEGKLIKDMAFPDTSVNYTGITVAGGTVYAAYSGSQQGFSVRDLELNQNSYVEVDADISGITADPDGNVYLSSTNRVYHYKANGTLVKDMEFDDAGINYTGISATF